jgi:hypothetical protein
VPVAIIDFDSAAPGTRLDDLGYAAWKHLNLGLIDLPVSEQGRRLGVIFESYGAAPSRHLLNAIAAAQAKMRRLIEGAPLGQGRDLALTQIGREQQWLEGHGDSLVS